MQQDEIDRAIREARERCNRGDYESARRVLEDAIEKTGDELQLGNLFHVEGTLEQAAQRFPWALHYLKVALQYRIDANDLLGQAYTMFQILMCRRASGEADDLLVEGFREVKDRIQALIAEPHNLSAEHMGNMLQNLAFCFQTERDWQAALKRYGEALLYRFEAKDRRGAALTLARIAECQLETGELGGAHESAQKALEIFREIGDVHRIAQVEATLQKIAEAVLVAHMRRKEEETYGFAIT